MIYIFLFGILIGHILAGFCYSNFTMYIVDKIESKIKQYKKASIKKKADIKFEKNKQEYLTIQKRFRW